MHRRARRAAALVVAATLLGACTGGGDDAQADTDLTTTSMSTTTVQLDWTRSDLHLLVTNPVEADVSMTPGHGVAGIAQRAEMFGGTARIRANRERWEVAVRLPLPEGVGL